MSTFYKSNFDLQTKILNYSQIGFYDIYIKSSDTINVFLNSGKQALYFFIPYDPHFNLQKIVIDGLSININKQMRGFSIEGTNYVSLTFWSDINDYNIQSNFWIIPSAICPKLSAYVYGTNSIEVHSDSNQLCVFSPTFDSKSKKYKIESGIPFSSGYHYTLIYTTDFNNPTYVNNDNKIESHSIKTSNFVSFYSYNSISKKLNEKNEYYTFFYKRTTKVKDVNYQQNYCFTDSVYKCNKFGCAFSSVFVFTECLDYNVQTIVIVGSVVGFVFAVCMLILISHFFVKNKNESLSTVPLNTNNEQNEGLVENDYMQSTQYQQDQNYLDENIYNNPYYPSQQYQYQQQLQYQNHNPNS